MILIGRVRAAAARLNPHIPPEVMGRATETLLDRRQSLTLIAGNMELESLIRDGIPVKWEDDGRG